MHDLNSYYLTHLGLDPDKIQTLPPEEVAQAAVEVAQQHPEHTLEEVQARAFARVAYKYHGQPTKLIHPANGGVSYVAVQGNQGPKGDKGDPGVPGEISYAKVNNIDFALKIIIILLLLVLCVERSHAQIKYVQVLNSSGNQIATYRDHFAFECSTNVTCTPGAGGLLTITASGGGGGSTAWDAITNPTVGSLTLTQFANGNDFWIVKRKTDISPTGSFFRFQNAAGADLCKLDITGTFSSCIFPNLTFNTTSPLGGGGTVTNGGSLTFTCGTCVVNNAANTAAAGMTLDMSAATTANGFKVPVGAGLTSGADGAIAYDSTAKITHVRTNGADSDVLATTATDTATTHAVFASATAGLYISRAVATSDLPGSGATTVSGQTCTLASTCTITRTCEFGLGDGANAITSGSSYTGSGCFNDFGATYTITAIRCFSDNSGTTTTNPTNDAGTALLTGALTCSSSFPSGTQSGTTTIGTSHWIKFPITADGTSKTITVEITYTR